MYIMMALGWIGVMLLVGVFVRAKIGIIRENLVPACIIGGIFGFILMNTTGLFGGIDDAAGLINLESGAFSTVVTQVFILVFISILITSNEKAEGETDSVYKKRVLRGSFGMGMIWVLLYALTALIGYAVLMLIGQWYDFDPVYGLLIPFAFTQGPGQAASLGAVIEAYGFPNAAMVGVSFASIGFLEAFVIGVPLARYGIKKGLAKHAGDINESVKSGIIKKEEQNKVMGTQTTHSGNIDPLSFHLSILGAGYIITFVVTYIAAKLIPSQATLIWGMMFFFGIFVGYLMKKVIKALKLDYLHDQATQRRITGFLTDFLVVASFMTVQLSVIKDWIIPIIILSIIIGLVTLLVCIYFGERFGDENDFERTLGLFGKATGTAPSGLALIRIVDSEFTTSTAVELGTMEVFMMPFMGVLLVIFGIAAGSISMPLSLALLALPIPIIMILLKVFKTWGSKTYELKGKEVASDEESAVS